MKYLFAFFFAFVIFSSENDSFKVDKIPAGWITSAKPPLFYSGGFRFIDNKGHRARIVQFTTNEYLVSFNPKAQFEIFGKKISAFRHHELPYLYDFAENMSKLQSEL